MHQCKRTNNRSWDRQGRDKRSGCITQENKYDKDREKGPGIVL